MLGRQLDVFGDEHDVAPAHERMRLFEPVRTLPGQTVIGHACNYCERTDTATNDATGRCVSGTGCNALDSERLSHRVA